MHLRTLRNFVATAAEGSISKAARKMNITQSALSQQLLNLENEMKAVLLRRSATGVRLTRSGEILLQFANEMLSLEEQAKHEILSSQSNISGDVSIAMSPTMSNFVLPRLLKALADSLPEVNLQLVEASSMRATDLLTDAHIDLGLIPEPPSDAVSIDHKVLLTTPMHLIGIKGAGFPAETAEGDIALREVAWNPLAVLSKQPSIKGMLLAEAGPSEQGLSISYESSSFNMIRAYVVNGLACTIIPEFVMFAGSPDPRFFSRRVVEPVIQRTYAIAWPTARRPSRSAQAVRGLIIELFDTQRRCEPTLSMSSKIG